MKGGPKEANCGSEAALWAHFGSKAHRHGSRKGTPADFYPRSRRENGFEEHSGVTLTYEGDFGSLWGDFGEHCGVTLGSLLTYEGDLGSLWRDFGAQLSLETIYI